MLHINTVNSYCKYVISVVLSVVHVWLESIERIETGLDLSDIAEVARLAAERTRGELMLWLLGASDSTLAALITSPSQPEDSARVTSVRVVAKRIAS